MSSERRPVPITLDAVTEDRRVVSDTELVLPDSKQQIELSYGTQCLFQTTLLSGAVGTAFNPDPSAGWLWGLDDVPFSDDPDYVISLNDQFNIAGDWMEDGVDQVNIAAGKICWRADLGTTQLKAALKRLNKLSNLMYANLWMLTAAGNIVWSWPVYVKMVYVDPTTAKAVDGITHLTTEAAAALYVPRWGDNSYVRRGADGRDQDLFADGKWRSRICVLVDGKPTQTWGDPED